MAFTTTCHLRLTTTASSHSSPRSTSRRRHWKAGEFPFPGTTSEPMSNPIPIKNLKKKVDARSEAKTWAYTVTEALADRTQAKDWHQTLQVFEMLKEQPFYHPKEGTYMKLLVLLERSGQSV